MRSIKKIEARMEGVLLMALFLLSFTDLSHEKSGAAEHPGARWGHSFVYHPIQKKMLLFGGTRERGGDYLDDTWVWEKGKWKRLDVPGPSARGFSAATFHQQRGTIILHGGRGNNRVTYSDLWEWNGDKWIQIESNSSFKADHHQIVYLEKQNALLAFGGWNGEAVLGDTWLWSGQWDRLNISSPPKRSAFSMVYHPQTSKVNLYGGLWINGQYADLWEWFDGQWTSLGGPYDNSSLDHHAMIYDEKRGAIVGFGGKNYRYQTQQTSFQIKEGEIVAITDEGPSARHSFGFTYDTHSKLGYLYGGKEYVDGEQIAVDDFWMWDGRTWSAIEAAGDEKD